MLAGILLPAIQTQVSEIILLTDHRMFTQQVGVQLPELQVPIEIMVLHQPVIAL
jgi:hypothetical protein